MSWASRGRVRVSGDRGTRVVSLTEVKRQVNEARKSRGRMARWEALKGVVEIFLVSCAYVSGMHDLLEARPFTGSNHVRFADYRRGVRIGRIANISVGITYQPGNAVAVLR